jgi:hypothetical protein
MFISLNIKLTGVALPEHLISFLVFNGVHVARNEHCFYVKIVSYITTWNYKREDI